MGQQQSVMSPRKRGTTIHSTNKINQNIFKRDPRLVEHILFTPQLFAGSIDSHVKKIERLIQLSPQHPLQLHIIDGINERFTVLKHEQNGKEELKGQNTQKEKEKLKNNTKNILKPQQQNIEKQCQFHELKTQQLFIGLLKKLQHWYHVQKQLMINLRSRNKDKKTTIRKKILPNYESTLNKQLYSKIFLKYYLIIVKRSFGSKDKQLKQFIIDFHQSIGKMICQMIEHDHLSEKKTIQLAYKSILIQKSGSKAKLQKVLSQIREQLRPIYLTKQHSLSLKPKQFDRVRQGARCYLDQLYLRSLKEAEDPDIIIDTNDGFGIVKSFPVMRVRQDKNR